MTGILEAYWDLYESIGLAVYTDLDYLSRVWSYHRRMVDSIISRGILAGAESTHGTHGLTL